MLAVLHAAVDPVVTNVVGGLRRFIESNHEEFEPEVTAHDAEGAFVQRVADTVERVEKGAEHAVQELKRFEESTHDSFEVVPASEYGHKLEAQIGLERS